MQARTSAVVLTEAAVTSAFHSVRRSSAAAALRSWFSVRTEKLAEVCSSIQKHNLSGSLGRYRSNSICGVFVVQQ